METGRLTSLQPSQTVGWGSRHQPKPGWGWVGVGGLSRDVICSRCNSVQHQDQARPWGWGGTGQHRPGVGDEAEQPGQHGGHRSISVLKHVPNNSEIEILQ